MPPTDASAAHYRSLDEADRDGVLGHMLRLDPAARYRRFGVPTKDEFLRDYCRLLDMSRVVLVGAFVGGVLRGVGELRRDGYAAEATSSVEGAYQRQGIGTELFRRLGDAARERGFTIYLVASRENEAARRIARRFGARLIDDRGTITETMDELMTRRPEPERL